MENHKLDIMNNRNLLSHVSGCQKSEIGVSAGLIPSEGSEEIPALSPAFGGVLAIFGISGLLVASAQSLALSPQDLFLCVSPCPNLPFLEDQQSYCLRAHSK